MSRIITNTNVIVDDFNFCKSFSKNTFVHFLTHFHTDHYEGLTQKWDYGHIYCSHLTGDFIHNKFPKVRNIHLCNYNQKYTVEIADGLTIDFWMFNAHHIPGSAMILFKGYMGTILFTGDFRYTYPMVTQNSILFPPKLREGLNKQQVVEQMHKISIPIDEMIFDNTYCNKNFKFGLQNEISEMMIKIIQKNRQKQLIYIAMGALGKHKILINIGKYFQTNIIVSEKQLQKITIAGLSTDFLTTNPNQGFIQLISKKNRAKIIQQTKKSHIGDNFICIDTDFLMLEHQSPDKINYIVPYSLHSNFRQMETFIRMIGPCILRKLVIPYANFRQVKLKIKIDHRLKFSKYLDFLESAVHKSQSGFAYLVRNYTEIYKLSEKFLRWFHPAQQNQLKSILNVGQQDHSLRGKHIKIPEDDVIIKKSNKDSLKTIASTLMASHKNLSIEDSFSFPTKSMSLHQNWEKTFLSQEKQQQQQNTMTMKPFQSQQ